MKRAISVLGGAVAALCVAAGSASAVVYDVNTTADPAGAGCTGGTCSMRQALARVAAGAGTGDTINLPAGTLLFPLGNMQVVKPVAIVGQGARNTILDGNNGPTITSFQVGSAPSSVRGVTYTRGRPGQSGAMSVNGTLTLTEVAVIGNTATSANGGGIYNSGTLTVDRSTIAGNSAATIGGGIYSSGTSLTVTNSTIVGNTANTLGTNWDGGGVYVNNPSEFVNTTIAGNSAKTGGGLYRASITVNLKNTIIAGNTATGGGATNCLGVSSTSLGGNLEDANTCDFSLASDQRNTPPGLGPLQNNGGPTDTMALSAGSAALDRGVDCPPPATDQRGTARPQGPACDIGAYELLVAPPAPPDKAKPVISDVKLGTGRFAANKTGPSTVARKKAPVGTTISYKLSEPATVRFSVERVLKGRKKGKKCSTRRKKGKRCTTYKAVKGDFSKLSASAGATSIKFTGRVGGKTLKRGSYRLVLLPVDTAGNKGLTQYKSFKIVKR